MKTYYIIIALFAIIVIDSKLEAQPLNRPNLEMNIRAGDQLYEDHNYYGAINFYREAYNESKDLDIYRKMARCYYLIRDYGRAERYYARLLRKEPEEEYQLYYEWGKIHRHLGNYDAARKAFKHVLPSNQDSLVWLTQQELKGMVQADGFKENPKLSTRNAGDGINEKFGELSPVLLDDETLIFSSIDARSAYELKPGGKDKNAQIHTANIGRDQSEFKKEYLESEINDKKYHIVHQTFSPDGNYIYYNRIKSIGDNILTSELMVSSKDTEGNWSKPRILEVPATWEVRHLSFAPFQGRSALFFNSSQIGGYGGDDLYYAFLDRDGLETPVNLGPKINSKGNEITPFFSDNTLYFSSDALPGMGGFDVFKTTWNGGEFGGISNMESSINSVNDDFGLKWSPSGDRAVFLSNRKGGQFLRSETCCDDIYIVDRKSVAIAADLESFSSKFPMKNATLSLYENINGDWKLIKTNTSKSYNHFFSLDKNRTYKIVGMKDGFFSDSININTVGIREDTVYNYSLVLNDLPDEPEEEIITINQTIRLNNIYYDFDDDKILSDAEKDLGYLLELLEKYPEMVIELSSHTDARGKDNYNEELSRRRAQSAKRWLVKRAVNPGRIRAIGYGEKKLLNQCVNGVQCTDDEHRLNRRTEFKIIEGPQEIVIERKKLKKNTEEEKKPTVRKEYPGAHISFERSFIDLGKVKRGDHPEMVFKFTNNGREDLVIEIVSGCECTELSWTEDPIPPGKQGEVRAILKSEEKEGSGQHNFDIDVITNTKDISHLLEYRAVIEN